MTLDQFSQYVSWGLYVLLFIITTVKAVRRPLKANVDIALFFSLPALIIGLSLATSFGLLAPSGILTAITVSLLLGMSYMLLRLVGDFSECTSGLMSLSCEVTLLLLVVGAFAFSSAYQMSFCSFRCYISWGFSRIPVGRLYANYSERPALRSGACVRWRWVPSGFACSLSRLR